MVGFRRSGHICAFVVYNSLQIFSQWILFAKLRESADRENSSLYGTTPRKRNIILALLMRVLENDYSSLNRKL